MKKKPMVKMHGQKISLRDKFTPALMAVAMLILILSAHTLAFDDEVAQVKINCQSSTYLADNPSKCGGHE